MAEENSSIAQAGQTAGNQNQNSKAGNLITVGKRFALPNGQGFTVLRLENNGQIIGQGVSRVLRPKDRLSIVTDNSRISFWFNQPGLAFSGGEYLPPVSPDDIRGGTIAFTLNSAESIPEGNVQIVLKGSQGAFYLSPILTFLSESRTPEEAQKKKQSAEEKQRGENFGKTGAGGGLGDVVANVLHTAGSAALAGVFGGVDPGLRRELKNAMASGNMAEIRQLSEKLAKSNDLEGLRSLESQTGDVSAKAVLRQALESAEKRQFTQRQTAGFASGKSTTFNQAARQSQTISGGGGGGGARVSASSRAVLDSAGGNQSQTINGQATETIQASGAQNFASQTDASGNIRFSANSELSRQTSAASSVQGQSRQTPVSQESQGQISVSGQAKAVLQTDAKARVLGQAGGEPSLKEAKQSAPPRPGQTAVSSPPSARPFSGTADLTGNFSSSGATIASTGLNAQTKAGGSSGVKLEAKDEAQKSSAAKTQILAQKPEGQKKDQNQERPEAKRPDEAPNVKNQNQKPAPQQVQAKRSRFSGLLSPTKTTKAGAELLAKLRLRQKPAILSLGLERAKIAEERKTQAKDGQVQSKQAEKSNTGQQANGQQKAGRGALERKFPEPVRQQNNDNRPDFRGGTSRPALDGEIDEPLANQGSGKGNEDQEAGELPKIPSEPGQEAEYGEEAQRQAQEQALVQEAPLSHAVDEAQAQKNKLAKDLLKSAAKKYGKELAASALAALWPYLLIALAIILGILILIAGVILFAYTGCNSPVGKVTTGGVTSYRLSYIGALYPSVCEGLDTASGGSFVSSQENVVTPQGVLSTASWTQLIQQTAGNYQPVDACILRVVVQKESAGQADVIGCDCAYNGNPAACLNQPKKYYPGYQFNWPVCSYGIGLTQWTIYQSTYASAQPGSPNYYKRWQDPQTPSRTPFGASFYTVSDLLDPQTSLNLTAQKFQAELRKNGGDVRAAFASYVGSSSSQSQFVNERMQLYDMCKANGG